MSWLGRSSCLNWTSYDPSNVATYLARESLLEAANELSSGPDEISLRSVLIRLDTPSDIKSTKQMVGLSIWSVRSGSEFEDVVRSVQVAKSRRIRPVQVVLLNRTLESATGILLEAGAQIVVSELLFLKKAVRKAIDNAFCVQQASHPLLVELPSFLQRFD